MREFMLYSNLETHDTVFELWGGSTKHPDVRFFFSDFKKSTIFDEDIDNLLPWVLECASKLNFPFHTRKVAEWALKVL